jgi:adenosylcobinamide-GDP ribazoletransferase
MKYFTLAISFLTVIPMKVKEQIFPGDLGKSSGWFPIIGIFLGGIVAGIFYAASFIFSPLLAAVLAVTAWIGLTGGLHLDGLADCCDGMLNASNPERRLEIMKDPRLGSFGGIGLVISILIKVACLYSLPSGIFWIAIPLAASTARWLLLWAGKQKMARLTGMGIDFSSGISLKSILPALFTMLAITTLSGWKGILIILLTHCVAWLIFRFSTRRLGGLTGDVFGLTVEISEIIVLLGFCIG